MMQRATQKSAGCGRRVRVCCLVLGAVWLAGIPAGAAEEAPPPETVAHLAYQKASKHFEQAPGDPGAAWLLARACFDWAEFSTNDTQRAELANKGINACQSALEKDSELAQAHYYLGMNQGQLARTMSVGALHLVRQMEIQFEKARELDPKFDQAGPDRNLGLLYLEAPGWPVSLGSRAKARAHLRRAVELAPHFPENRLNLMEAYARWRKMDLVKRELQAWEDDLQVAHREFSGNQWRGAWQEWDRRLEKLKQEVEKVAPVLRSPKDRD